MACVYESSAECVDVLLWAGRWNDCGHASKVKKKKDYIDFIWVSCLWRHFKMTFYRCGVKTLYRLKHFWNEIIKTALYTDYILESCNGIAFMCPKAQRTVYTSRRTIKPSVEVKIELKFLCHNNVSVCEREQMYYATGKWCCIFEACLYDLNKCIGCVMRGLSLTATAGLFELVQYLGSWISLLSWGPCLSRGTLTTTQSHTLSIHMDCVISSFSHYITGSLGGHTNPLQMIFQ